MQFTKTKELKIGSAGEHLTMFEAFLEGYKSYLANGHANYDVVIDAHNILYRTQVKATSTTSAAKHKQSFRYQIRRKMNKEYLTPYTLDDFELYAFACLPLRRVAFIPHKDVDATFKVTIRLEEHDFYTLDRAIKILEG